MLPLALTWLDWDTIWLAFAVGLAFYMLFGLLKAVRGRCMSQLCRRIDAEVTWEHNHDALECFKSTPTGAKHDNGQVSNAMVHHANDARIVVFDYEYFPTPQLARRNKYRRTFVALLPNDHNFPAFTMRPEGPIQVVSEWIGMQDIDFREHMEFSDRYVLQSDHEAFIRKFFTPEMLDFFAANEGWWLECSRRGMIMYKGHRQLDAEEMKAAIKMAIRINELFSSRGAILLSHGLSGVTGLNATSWMPDGMDIDSHQRTIG